jgi:polysaccharide deacetylase/hemolysin type calcium-binding protein
LRTARLLAVIAAALLLFAVSASAETVQGGPEAETLIGTRKADRIFGRGGDDRLVGGPGNDLLVGGPGRDTIIGGPGADRISAADGEPDKIDCGPGRDVAVVDRLDTVAADCEVVRGEKQRPATTSRPSEDTAPAPSGESISPQPSSAAPSPGTSPPSAPIEEEKEEEKEKGPERIPAYEENPLALFGENNGWTGNGVGSFGTGPPSGSLHTYQIRTDGKGHASVATSPQLSPVDLSASHVSVLGEVGYASNLEEVRIRLASGSIATDYAEAVVWKEGRDAAMLNGTFQYQSIPTGGFTVHGNVDWSKIDRAQLTVTDEGSGSVEFVAAAIYAVPTYRTPTVSFAFDDSLESAFTMALPKLSADELPATEYVIADTIGTPGFLTESQLSAMQADHWEIGGHAFTLADHNEPSGFNSLSPQRLEEDFDDMREWMHQHGFPQRTFAYPKGYLGSEVRKYARRDYCAARATLEGPETIPPRDPFTIRGFQIDGTTTHVAELEQKVENAIAEKSWLLLTFHDLVSGTPGEERQFNSGEFSQLVDYIHTRVTEGRLQVRTVADSIGC